MRASSIYRRFNEETALSCIMGRVGSNSFGAKDLLGNCMIYDMIRMTLASP